LEEKTGGEVRIEIYKDPAELGQFITVASEICSRTYQRALTGGFADNPETRCLLNQAARDKRLRAYLLYAGPEALAFEAGLLYNSTYFAEYRGFDPRWSAGSPGTLLLLKVLVELSSRGIAKAYDFGFGDASYKHRYGRQNRQEASIYIFAPRFYPVAINLLRTSVTAFETALRQVLTRLGVAGWVKKRWRYLLQKSHDD